MANRARARSTWAAGALSERLRRVSSWRSSAVSGRRGSFRWRDMGHLGARGSPHHYTSSHGRRPTSGQTLGAFARYFDLTIIEQPNPDVLTERESAIEAALFASGRPVLVVPYIHKAPLQLEQVLVAWDGSATAARALGDALPLLARAKNLQVVSVVDGNEGISGPRIVRHLEQHAITAKFHSLPGADDPTDALLSYAADCCADLLVMGGYGHSRFREFLLGGTTRGILASMTLPVFMSH